MSDLATRLAALSPTKRALLERTLAKDRAQRSLARARPPPPRGALEMTTSGEVLFALQPEGEARPFFCVHAVGGSAFSFLPLGAALALHRQPLYAFQAVGLSGEAPVERRVEDMAATYIRAMRSAQPQGPYRVVGWCSGGSIAFEMARQLEGAGAGVEALVILDTPAPVPGNPQAEGEDYGDDTAAWLAELVRPIARFFKKDVPLEADLLRGLSHDEQLGLVLEGGKAMGILPPSTGVRVIEGLLAVFRAQMEAWREYRLKPYEGPLTLVRPSEKLRPEDEIDPELWRPYCGRLQLLWVPGDHHTMVQEPAVAETARALLASVSS